MEKILVLIIGFIMTVVSAIGHIPEIPEEPASESIHAEVPGEGSEAEASLTEDTGSDIQNTGLLRSLSLSARTTETLDFSPLTEEERSAAEEIFRTIGIPYMEIWEITAWGRFDGGMFLYIVSDKIFDHGGICGGLLFTYPDPLKGHLFVYTGETIKLLSDAYEEGVIPYDTLKALHEAWYADDPELEALYCSECAEGVIRTLLFDENAVFERIAEDEGRIPSGEAVPVALSGNWDPKLLVNRYFSDFHINGSSEIIHGNRIRISSPDHEGYAVSLRLDISGYPAVVIETPNGNVLARGAEFGDLYCDLMDQYDAAAAAAEIETYVEEDADYIIYADVNQRGIPETIRVVRNDAGFHVDVLDRSGRYIVKPVGWGAEPGIDISSGALILSETEDGWHLLQYEDSSEKNDTLYAIGIHEVRQIPSIWGYRLGINSVVSWESISGELSADQEALETYGAVSESYFDHAVLVCGFLDGRAVLGDDEEAQAVLEYYKGLNPFYRTYAGIYPEIADETTPLSERLSQLKGAVRNSYNDTNTVYTITGSYGSVRALNLEERFHELYDPVSEVAGRYVDLDGFQWLYADLTKEASFRIEGAPQSVFGGPLGEYYAYESGSLEKLTSVIRPGYGTRWPDAVEGQRYIVIGNDVAGASGNVIFGVIQRNEE